IAWSARADYVFNRISNLMDLKETNESLFSAEQKKYSDLKTKLRKEPEFVEYSRTFSQDVLWDKYKTDLTDFNMKMIEARSVFGDKYSRVKSLQDQINELNDKMKSLAQDAMKVSAKTESRNPTHQILLNQIIESELNQITYSARRDAADKLLKQMEPEKERILSEMPENQYELDKMSREVGYKVDVYKDLLTKKVESEIMSLDSVGDKTRVKGGIEIVDLAQPSSRPVSPRIKFIIVVAGIVGLAVGLAVAFLTEYIEQT
ncbi:MAG: protein tyrosine kinase modulator, partial [Candidatus Poribacteria bacterium]|nr:protein tyrosine kinase modulator [Candidatus Poribacteria bacterium]